MSHHVHGEGAIALERSRFLDYVALTKFDLQDCILTTGNGSAKSLAYIIPAVDFIARNGSGHGIKAIAVYPMNALANSQENELRKFLHLGFPDDKGPVTFRK